MLYAVILQSWQKKFKKRKTLVKNYFQFRKHKHDEMIFEIGADINLSELQHRVSIWSVNYCHEEL